VGLTDALRIPRYDYAHHHHQSADPSSNNTIKASHNICRYDPDEQLYLHSTGPAIAAGNLWGRGNPVVQIKREEHLEHLHLVLIGYSGACEASANPRTDNLTSSEHRNRILESRSKEEGIKSSDNSIRKSAYYGHLIGICLPNSFLGLAHN
jgi:hypothetical protein